MKILAAMIMAHKNLEQLTKLIEALKHDDIDLLCIWTLNSMSRRRISRH